MQHKPSKRYMRALGGLYGDIAPNPSVTPTEKRSPRGDAPSVPKEDYEQIKAAAWLDKNNILFYHIPNGGSRHYLEAIKFKRMGVKAGVLDVCIPIARKGHHGLYIELKRSDGKGKVTDAQIYWMTELKKQGYDVYVAHGACALIEYVKNYLGDSP